MDSIMTVATYLRVSTREQEVENQRLDLLKYVQFCGWHVVQEYADVGVSGSKNRRPELDRMMADARRRKFKVVLVWKFDRFARSVKHLIDALHEFRELGIRFVSLQENVDLGTSLGQAMFAIIAAIAQLERDLIRERIMAGLRRVRAEGRKLGRPAKELDLPKVLEFRAQGMTIREIAEAMALSKSRVAQAIKARPGELSRSTLGTNGIAS